jgi:hypothetical protein
VMAGKVGYLEQLCVQPNGWYRTTEMKAAAVGQIHRPVGGCTNPTALALDVDLPA